MSSGSGCTCLLVTGLLFLLPVGLQADEFSFELEEIEKKPLQWGGYAELKFEHQDVNQGAVLATLGFSDQPPATIDRFSPSLQVNGSYLTGSTSFNWLLKAAGQQDNIGWIDYADIYEAYGRIKPSKQATVDLGKQSYKWGKGYAWNPAAFINRPKDPNNPEDALEGYITGELDLINSFVDNDYLGNIALTTVLLPVYDDVNDDFGDSDNINLAAKLYLLYLDTDIDFIFYTGNSRSTSFGADFSRNISTNFEIHGEAAYLTSVDKLFLLENSDTRLDEDGVFKGLLGFRYLTQYDLTSIIEYYHNSGGYSEDERTLFYQYAADAAKEEDSSGSTGLIQKAREMSLRGYGKPYVGRNYLYARFILKEPFDIVYLTPGLTAIVNLDDRSSSITPELVYTGFTNWEMRLRFSLLIGGSFTEYGEKTISNKVEFRLRWYF